MKFLKPNMNQINPYRKGVNLIKRRLPWDIRKESWRSRKILKSYIDFCKGEKCVILCNGPTLNDVDFECIKESGVKTFGLNKINLLFDKVDFFPSYIVSVNEYVIFQNKGFFEKTSIPTFLDSSASNYRELKKNKNITFLHSSPVRDFAKDCSFSLYQGSTVTYVALQLAYHMGFSEVALVGADHNFSEKGPAGKVVSSGDKDANHFDPNYFSGGVQWQLPNLSESEIAYFIADKEFKEDGRKVWNATNGGFLEVFDRTTLDEFLGYK